MEPHTIRKVISYLCVAVLCVLLFFLPALDGSDWVFAWDLLLTAALFGLFWAVLPSKTGMLLGGAYAVLSLACTLYVLATAETSMGWSSLILVIPTFPWLFLGLILGSDLVFYAAIPLNFTILYIGGRLIERRLPRPRAGG